MDGLGWILKIFKQTHQKRPEAKVNLQNTSQTIHNDAIPMSFQPLGAALALDHYFIGLMVSGLWPLAETFVSPYHASNMHVCVVGVP